MGDYKCPHTCAYRTNAGFCGKTGGYESCQYIKYLEKLEKEKTNIKPYAGKRTNADRIRSMTDEELADFLGSIIHDYGQGTAEIEGAGYVIDDWLDWLKEEVESNDS